MSFFAHSFELPAWAADVPEDWQRNWLKWSVHLSTKRPTEEEKERLPYISNEDIESWTGRLLNEEPKPSDADSRKFQAGDVLVNKLRPYLAKIYHADFDGVSSGEILSLRPSGTVFPRFLFYVVASKGFIDAIDAETFGAKMPRADWEIVGHQPLPLPPLPIQRRIAQFLDEKTARIDALIEKKRELLDRLAEKRQALITRAVTQGLDPDVPRKPSGIDWLGEIPEHWEIQRLKFKSTKIGSGVTPRGGASVYIESGVMLVRSQNVHSEGLQLSDVVYIDVETHKTMANTEVHKRDVLLNITGASIGRSCVFDIEGVSANVNQHVCIIRLNRMTDSDFVNMFLQSSIGQAQIDMAQNGASREGLSFSSLGNFLVPAPARDEQKAIVENVSQVIARLVNQVRKVERSIQLLVEYRSALITAAVTGQIEELR